MPHLRLFSRNAGRFKASSASFRSLSTAKSFADTVFSRNIIDKSPSQALVCVIFFAWLRLKNTQRALLAVIPADSRLPRDSFPALLRLKHQPRALLAVTLADFQLLLASFTVYLRLKNTHKQFLAVIPADSPILQVSFVARLQLNSPAHPFLAVSHLELTPNSTPKTHNTSYILLF